MPGPPPKPTALRVAQGNPGRKPLNRFEPKPALAAVCPEPLDHLDKTAAEVWRTLAPELHRLGLLTNADLNAFSEYCCYQGLFIDCSERLKIEGLIATSKNGQPYQHPLLGVRNKASEKLKTLSQQFGLTPAARTRLQIESVSTAGESSIERRLFG